MKPNEIIPISVEGLEIAQTYLSTQSIKETADLLGIHESQVAQYLSKSEVKNYIDHVYLSAGYRNRFKIAETLDTIIDKKLQEMMESDLGSTKDIADLLQMAHKMRMDELKAMTEHEKVKAPKIQTNVQINSPYGEGNYGSLLSKLLDA